MVVLCAVSKSKRRKSCAFAFNVASKRLRADREIVKHCVRNDKYAESTPYIDSSLLSDRDFVLELIAESDHIFEWTQFRDREFLLEAVAANPDVVYHYEDEFGEFLDNKEFVLEMISRTPEYYVYGAVSERLRGDRDVMACGLGPTQLHDVPMPFRCDRAIVLMAAKKSPGYLLQYLSYSCDIPEDVCDSFLADRDIVLAAVTTQGSDLMYAAPQFRYDREVVMAAVASGCQMVHVPFHIQEDPTIQLCRPITCKTDKRTIDLLISSIDNAADRYLHTISAYKHEYFFWATKPFTATNTLPFIFEHVDNYIQDPHISNEVLTRLADCMNAPFAFNNLWKIVPQRDFNETVTEEYIVQQIINLLPGKQIDAKSKKREFLNFERIYETVTGAIRRLTEISDTLPQIAKSFDEKLSVHKRWGQDYRRWAEQIERIAAKVHDPMNGFAFVVLKSKYKEEFD